MEALHKKPVILNIETVARSRLFKIESVDLQFSNGTRRLYERMSPSSRQSVMIVPVINDQLILIHEYAVGLEDYELGFPKGLMEPGETPIEAANRELMEEIGFGAKKLTLLSQVTMAPSYFSSVMNIVLAEDLYPEKHEGDEPEPLIVRHWPMNEMMSLLNRNDFKEARNMCALFLAKAHFKL